MKAIVVDGQGGGMGKAIAAQLRKCFPALRIVAVGTNSIATSVMMKAGADVGATGENAVIYQCTRAEKEDYILGAQGICLANAMLGEISPAMAAAVADSRAQKLLLPITSCGVHVLGVAEKPLAEYLAEMAEFIGAAQCENQG